ncbi:MAG: cysteine--tRNA ligase [Chloroflexi bacterium RBG_16_68_14]|nr:MAG: cysteine--tRNA ligase [Chloroflexi bacterium RBG_16_68_14]
MPLKLRNTLSGQYEEFVPIGDVVKLYVCGVTPWEVSHVGHAMSYIVFDVLRRYLEYRGYRVRHVQNFTDIEDKIIARAERLGIDIGQLTEEMIERYHQEMRALNILPAHVYPRATEETPTMIEMIQALIEKGYAYQANGDVYYRVTRKEDYGKLSHRPLDAMVAGARVEPGEQKENPVDFALWKAAKPGEPSWESPWGPGRPGWHIECSAMSLRYLGEQIDIHGGGEDLIFPHHENEIAQTEAYTEKPPFVRYWLHNAWVKAGEEKMSKSLGNFVPISEALERWPVDAIRLWVLISPYRTPLSYSEEALAAAQRGAERLRLAARASPDPSASLRAGGAGEGEAVDAAPYRQQFIEAMDDDLNTAKALAALFDLAHEIHRARDETRPIGEAQTVLLELADVLGLTLAEPEADMSAAPFIELLIAIRDELRQAKQFELADRVRSGLAELGIALEDTPQGTEWRRRE